jgi:type III restriction enzyme
MNQQDIQDKTRAAVRWCGYASEHARSVGGKPWHYLLVPDTAIVSAASVGGLMALYERRDDAGASL